jgi:hypothetical protein
MDFHDYPNDPFYMNQVRDFDWCRTELKNLGRPPFEKNPHIDRELLTSFWSDYAAMLRSFASSTKPFYLDYQEYNRKDKK